MSEKRKLKIKNDLNFDYIIKDILDNPKFRQMRNISHHNSTDRLSHCLNVAYKSYKIAIKLGADHVSAARAGLLHDYFFEDPQNCETIKERIDLIKTHHSEYALINAKTDFEVNEIEEDAIYCHMYPVSRQRPKYRESWIVLLADDLVSFGEKSYSFRYAVNLMVLFLFNSLLK